jgi:pimeloyl-ACP methyl ester carboxylesterase
MTHLTTPAADGTPLAYEVHGTSGPWLVFTNGYTTSSFYWRHLLEHYQGRARMLTWDLRGHGRSGAARDLSSFDIPACVDDLRRVMDAADVPNATMLGFSFGCQVVLESWRHIPDRIDAVVPALGTFEHPFNNVFHPILGPQIFKLFARLAPTLAPQILALVGATADLPIGYQIAVATGQVAPHVPYEHMKPFFEHFRQIDGATWAALGIAAQAHSARDVLPTIAAPTLIIGGGKDDWTPPSMSRHMHAAIPDAELLFIPDAGHTGLLGHADVIIPALDAFLSKHGLLG